MSNLPSWVPLPTHWPTADHPTIKRPTNSRALRRRWKRFCAGDLSAWPWPLELRCDNPGWGGWIKNLEIP